MNSTALEGIHTTPFPKPMSARRLWHAYLTEARYESVRMLRTPGFSLPFLGLPVVLYLLFGVVIFGAVVRNDPGAGAFIFTAFVVFGVMGPGMFGFGLALAVEREQGLLRLKRAQPMPPAAFLLAKLLMAMLFSAIVALTVILAAVLVVHVRLALGRWVLVALISILGSAPFSAIGLLIGSLASGKSAPAYVNLIYQVMMHLSGLFYPLPKFLMAIAPIWPTYHLQQLVVQAMRGPARGSSVAHVAVLAGVTLVFSALAVRRLGRVG